MSKKNPGLLLIDILNSTDKISEYTNGLTFEEFINDSKTIDAVIRNFEIIGEAANRLSEEFKEIYPTVEWHRIRGVAIESFTTIWEFTMKPYGLSRRISYLF